MNLTVFLNELGLGGTEKAACLWAGLLKQRHPDWKIQVLSLQDGPRRADLERFGIPLHVCPTGLISNNIDFLSDRLHSADVIHAHCPGSQHQGDILGQVLKKLGRKIPVVQTNIFGRLDNPLENEWTNFRLFISWTSCVQAARRSGRKLDLDFFRHQSVAVYPVLDPFGATVQVQGSRAILQNAADEFRASIGLKSCHVLFGRFSRPEPNKWTPLVLDAFLAAYRENPNIRLLLREPPPAVASNLLSQNLATWFPYANQERGTTNLEPTNSSVIRHPSSIILLPTTSDPEELKISQLACDVVLHTSSIGESFGYGIAEPMALSKPIITSSVPWHDQAQIELAKHGECGLTASTVSSMKKAILRMAENNEWRIKCGDAARQHILALADATKSTDRLEAALHYALQGIDNACSKEDLHKAIETEKYLRESQWGHNLAQQTYLRSSAAKVYGFRTLRLLRHKMRMLTHG
jgi:glycosyltransferase involved in cell wall biosynthesis